MTFGAPNCRAPKCFSLGCEWAVNGLFRVPFRALPVLFWAFRAIFPSKRGWTFLSNVGPWEGHSRFRMFPCTTLACTNMFLREQIVWRLSRSEATPQAKLTKVNKVKYICDLNFPDNVLKKYMEHFIRKRQVFCLFPAFPIVSVERSRVYMCVFNPGGPPPFTTTLTHGGRGEFGYRKTSGVPTFYKTLSFVKETARDNKSVF